MADLTYPEAIVVGLLQGVSELFPVSSLGHSVLLPALIGGKWGQDLDISAEGSPYLAVLVAMHVATALALVLFFWRDWVRVIGGLITSIKHRRIDTPDERLGWLLIVGTIPVGIAGLALEHTLRTHLGKPIPAAIFLAVNGIVLYASEKLRDRKEPPGRKNDPEATIVMSLEETTPLSAVAVEQATDRRLARLSIVDALAVGAAQILALFPGISRSGITIVAGLLKGLRHEDAARFAFLLATPVILAAGLLKMPELFKPEAQGVLGPAMVGSLVAGVASYVSVRFLTSYFETRTLVPFAIYCIVGGLGSLIWLTI
ncbi:MAG TPA: undecaprenyl-diphosphate phosphatase [Pseudonocardiaceae bacterium]|nr:undecaprenyl-diphosphate phosphatase [Pseudonocardiaceae bacterium]